MNWLLSDVGGTTEGDCMMSSGRLQSESEESQEILSIQGLLCC